jgi:glycine cleavage system H protein
MDTMHEKIRFTQEHEWVSIDKNIATIGITEHATEELGEVVFVELPEEDSEYDQNEEIGTIESVKTVSSIYSPVSGRIVSINEDLKNSPNIINEQPMGDGWLVKIDCTDISEANSLMTYDEYQSFILGESENNNEEEIEELTNQV